MEELDDVINVPREKLWAQAMLFACDVTNKSVTTSTDGGKSVRTMVWKIPYCRSFETVWSGRIRATKRA